MSLGGLRSRDASPGLRYSASRRYAGPRFLRPSGNLKVRRRRRRRTALKLTAWCLLWLAGASAAAFGFSRGWAMLVEPTRFPLEKLLVQGGGPEIDADVTRALSPLIGRNIFTIELHEVERLASANRWVRGVSVHRRLPAGLLVLVERRQVEALALFAGEVRMVGEAGVDLGAYEPERSGEDHPVITGLDTTDAEERAARLGRAMGALEALEGGAPGMAASLSEIDASRADRLRVTLRDLRPPIFLDPAEPLRNIRHLEAVRARLDAASLEVQYIDLRFQDRIAVMPIRDDEGKSGA